MSKGNGGQGRKNTGGKAETPVPSNRVGGNKTPKQKGNGNSST